MMRKEMLILQINKDDKEILREMARSIGLSMSAYVRLLIKQSEVTDAKRLYQKNYR